MPPLSLNLKGWKDEATLWLGHRKNRKQVGVGDNSATKEESLCCWDDIVSAEYGAGFVPITFLGPPKEYFGEGSHRYAYMLLEAITLLRKYGFSVHISSLGHIQKQPTRSHQRYRKHCQVPGLLGKLLREATPEIQIQVVQQEGARNTVVAYLSFLCYNRPWLNVLCIGTDQEREELRSILAKRFMLVGLSHGAKTVPVDTSCLKLVNTSDFTVNVTTGIGHQNTGLLTKFEMEKDGKIVCRALWSYRNPCLDIVGPCMERFEIAPEWRDLGVDTLLLCTMEQKMFQKFQTLVAFHLQVNNVNDYDASILRWFTRRGFTHIDRRRSCALCKGFAMI